MGAQGVAAEALAGNMLSLVETQTLSVRAKVNAPIRMRHSMIPYSTFSTPVSSLINLFMAAFIRKSPQNMHYSAS